MQCRRKATSNDQKFEGCDEQDMLEWFSQHRGQNVPINGPMMQRKADEFFLRHTLSYQSTKRLQSMYPVAASGKDPEDPPPVDANSQPGPYTEPQPGSSTAPLSAPLTSTRPFDEETWQILAPDCTYEECITADDDITVWSTLGNADIIREQQESSDEEEEEEMEEDPEDIPTTKDILKAGDVYQEHLSARALAKSCGSSSIIMSLSDDSINKLDNQSTPKLLLHLFLILFKRFIVLSAEQLVSVTMGVWSLGQSVPVRGRTMKEYEEQLAQLKKENFNLKLRIYFLEERTNRMGECPDKEVLLNTNIELKVETEALRKERDEKEELLVQASRLVELTDKQYREQLDKLNENKEHEIGLLKRRIQELEKCVEVMKACTEVGVSAHRHELQLEDSNLNLELSRSPSLGGQQDKNRLQEVTEMSQGERLRGKSERINHLERDLQAAQQEADQVKLRCQGLEAELKQRDHRLEELLQELKQRGQELAEKDLTIQERDSLIEENQSQLEQQKKVLGEIQTTLDDNQQQINALRVTLLARDAIIADLEGRLSTARGAAHKLEVRLDATQQEGAKLQEEIKTIRSQYRRSSGRSQLSLPDTTQRHLKTLEEAEHLLAVKLRETQRQAQSGEEARLKLEAQVRDAEERIQEREVKLQRMEEDNRKACLAIEGFMKRSKCQSREVEQLQAECRRKDRRIQALTLEMSQLREGCYKVQARISAPTVHIDMTEEENEQLYVCSPLVLSIISSLRKCSVLLVRVLYSPVVVGTCLILSDMTLRLGEWRKTWLGRNSKYTIALSVPHSSLMSLDQMKPRLDWAVAVNFILDAAITSLSTTGAGDTCVIMVWKNPVEGFDDCGVFDVEVGAVEVDSCEVMEVNNCGIGGCGDTEVEALGDSNRLWAEVESKDKKLLELTKDRDSISLEMEKQVQVSHTLPSLSPPFSFWVVSCTNTRSITFQGLLESLKQKESQLAEAEEKLSSATATLQGQDNRITELEEEVRGLREEVMSLREERATAEKKHQESQTEKTEEGQKLQDKDTEIERLSLELRRKTHNLQELVNKELWNKNREIEKLQARLTTLGERKELEIFSLQQEVTARDFQLKMLQSKVSELGQHLNLTGTVYLGELAGGEVGSLRDERNYLNRKVEELKEKLRHTPERDNDSVVVATLRNEVAAAREEADRAEMWRREAGEVCTHLTRRLEELARFLASLLTSVPAGGKKRRLIERAVENSMELSRSVSASFGAAISAGDATHSVSSCLTSMSEVNVSLLELLAAADEEGEQTQTIARLRAEVETLKQELKQRDGEMNQVTSMTFYNSQMDGTAGSKPPRVSGSFKQTDDATLVKVGDCRTTSKQIGTGRSAKIRRSSSASAVALATIQQNLLQEVTYSESEAWSEPDRNVSLARIGLPEETTGVLRRRSLQEVTQSSESEEETAQETATKPGYRSRAEGDVRILVTKVRGLEQINDALKSELSVFHQWASQQTRPLTRETSVNTSEGPPMMDKSTSVQSVPVNTAELLREIQRQREKLESSLRHNDQMRVALEGVLSAAVGAGEVSRVMEGVKEVTDRLDDANSYNHALEEQLKLSHDTVSSLEQQLATLTSRLHESDNEVLERKCLLLEMENQANQQSLELHHQIVALETRLQETEQALSKANTRIQDLEAKESSLQSKLRDAEESASKRLQEVDKKLQEAERLKEQFEAGIHCQKEEADKIRVEADTRVQEAHDKFKLQERELHRKLANTERESCERQSELEKRLNQLALETSQTALERTRLSSEKLRLEQDVRRLEGRGTEMSREKRGLERDVEQLYRQVSAERLYRQVSVERLYTQVCVERLYTQVSVERLYRQVSVERLYIQVSAKQLYIQVSAERLYIQVSVEQRYRQVSAKQLYIQVSVEQRYIQVSVEQLYRQVSMEQRYIQVSILKQQKAQLEKRLGDYEAANLELEKNMNRLRMRSSRHSETGSDCTSVLRRAVSIPRVTTHYLNLVLRLAVSIPRVTTHYLNLVLRRAVSIPQVTTHYLNLVLRRAVSIPQVTTHYLNLVLRRAVSIPRVTTHYLNLVLRWAVSVPRDTTLYLNLVLRRAVSVPRETTLYLNLVLRRAVSVPRETTLYLNLVLRRAVSVPRETTLYLNLVLRRAVSVPRETTLYLNLVLRRAVSVPRETTLYLNLVLRRAVSVPRETTLYLNLVLRRAVSVPRETTLYLNLVLRRAVSVPRETTLYLNLVLRRAVSVPRETTLYLNLVLRRAVSVPRETTLYLNLVLRRAVSVPRETTLYLNLVLRRAVSVPRETTLYLNLVLRRAVSVPRETTLYLNLVLRRAVSVPRETTLYLNLVLRRAVSVPRETTLYLNLVLRRAVSVPRETTLYLNLVLRRAVSIPRETTLYLNLVLRRAVSIPRETTLYLNLVLRRALSIPQACSQSSGLEMVGDEASSLELKDPRSTSQPILSRQRSEMSDYVSEDQEYEAVFTQTCSSRLWVTVPAGVPRTLNNSSPDLGIESDPGRFSSLEAPNNTGRIQLVTVTTGEAKDQPCLEQENMELKRRLLRTRRTLEETLAQLTVANQRKKQMERAICRQIHKTNHILKTTRSNLEAAASDEPYPSADDRN
uniref:Centrosomin N-terminal motif 1 domain-containing protein n=1 Tax=Timema tahoe TaxID=61484 RepID=A0A7R9ILK0_9NEOP|nr:unnamed protein product [Timema tahoe]